MLEDTDRYIEKVLFNREACDGWEAIGPYSSDEIPDYKKTSTCTHSEAFYEDGCYPAARGPRMFSEIIEDAWLIVELMVNRMGYDNPGFNWLGPIFKPENRYLTSEGYPLGTTCWYVQIECKGYIKNICAGTPMIAICEAALEVLRLERKI